MLAEFVNKIVSLAGAKTYEVEGRTYATDRLFEVRPVVDYPSDLSVNSLSAICKLIHAEYGQLNKINRGAILVNVDTYDRVTVYTSWDDRYHRSAIYQATPGLTGFNPGWRKRDAAIIELRSMFQETEDSRYLLELLSRITDENSVTSSDNGVTQKVTANTGIALNTVVPVKPRVLLKPYRTFRELEQPASEFILRVDAERGIGLFEADGGTWQLAAREEAAAFLSEGLSDLIKDGKVVVMN